MSKLSFNEFMEINYPNYSEGSGECTPIDRIRMRLREWLKTPLKSSE